MLRLAWNADLSGFGFERFPEAKFRFLSCLTKFRFLLKDFQKLFLDQDSAENYSRLNDLNRILNPRKGLKRIIVGYKEGRELVKCFQ
jgi:hypothetical protein